MCVYVYVFVFYIYVCKIPNIIKYLSQKWNIFDLSVFFYKIQ